MKTVKEIPRNYLCPNCGENTGERAANYGFPSGIYQVHKCKCGKTLLSQYDASSKAGEFYWKVIEKGERFD